MTAEAAPVLTQPGPTNSHAAMVRIPTQHRRNEHINCGPCSAARRDANQVRDDSVVIDLVAGARNGDKQAWDALVERYAPLIWSICRQYRLGDADAEDVGQMVWLRLMDQLGNLRNPAALPGWLVTTTRRECLQVRQAAARLPQVTSPLMSTENMADTDAVPAEHELLLAERHAALYEAFSDLPPGCKQLMTLLTADPPMSYAEISAKLGIPAGSIGPTRNRCLARLRRHPAVAALIDADVQPSEPLPAAPIGPVQ